MCCALAKKKGFPFYLCAVFIISGNITWEIGCFYFARWIGIAKKNGVGRFYLVLYATDAANNFCLKIHEKPTTSEEKETLKKMVCLSSKRYNSYSIQWYHVPKSLYWRLDESLCEPNRNRCASDSHKSSEINVLANMENVLLAITIIFTPTKVTTHCQSGNCLRLSRDRTIKRGYW